MPISRIARRCALPNSWRCVRVRRWTWDSLSRRRIDGDELEDAGWFGRTNVAEIRSLGLRLPFRGMVAH
jgi:hypothetical protein